MDLYMYKEEMLNLMESVQVSQQKYTFAQIMQNLRRYVTSKNLFSPSDPAIIVLGDDPLTKLFLGFSTFNLKDMQNRHKLMLLMSRHLQVSHPDPADPGPAEESRQSQGIKRKVSSTDFEEPVSPMYLHMPPSPVSDSSDETTFSFQDYTTEEAQNSGSGSDTDFIMGEEIDLSCAISKVAKSIERLSSPCLVDSGSDVAFWADHSNSDWWSELESTPKDKWQCEKCNMWNDSKRGHCYLCQVPIKRTGKQKKLLSRNQRRWIKQQAQETAKEEKIKSSQDSYATEEETDEQEKCIICVTRNANALILHGQTAHNVCCYGCARKLQKVAQSNTCPTCRREIDRVVHLL